MVCQKAVECLKEKVQDEMEPDDQRCCHTKVLGPENFTAREARAGVVFLPACPRARALLFCATTKSKCRAKIQAPDTKGLKKNEFSRVSEKFLLSWNCPVSTSRFLLTKGLLQKDCMIFLKSTVKTSHFSVGADRVGGASVGRNPFTHSTVPGRKQQQYREAITH